MGSNIHRWHSTAYKVTHLSLFCLCQCCHLPSYKCISHTMCWWYDVVCVYSPYFGHSICFNADRDLYQWLAAIMLAQVTHQRTSPLVVVVVVVENQLSYLWDKVPTVCWWVDNLLFSWWCGVWCVPSTLKDSVYHQRPDRQWADDVFSLTSQSALIDWHPSVHLSVCLSVCLPQSTDVCLGNCCQGYCEFMWLYNVHRVQEKKRPVAFLL